MSLLLDYASVFIQVVTLVVTALGLGFVVVSLRQTGEQQRIEAGPYVRVDLGSTDLPMPNFKPPVTSYQNRALVSDPEDGSDGPVISAWFRNLQSHPLGTAYGVYARFLVEAGSNPDLSEIAVDVPYLQFGTNVLIQIYRVPKGEDLLVTLIELRFFDLYDRRHMHLIGEEGTNALFGRLRVAVHNDTARAVAEGRPRGSKVRYDDE